jgi:tetratricopeptide (TPR) repeat protein
MVVAGLGVHLSTVSLLPSFLYLVVLGAAKPDRRKDAAVGLAALVAGLATLSWLLWWISPGYTLWTGVSQIADVSTSSQGRGAGLSYVFGWTHLRDFINEQQLTGPLAAFLFVPAVVYAARRREFTRPASAFFALAAGLYLVGSWAVAEPLLGYARDWDLFAPAAVTYCAAGLYFLIHHVRSPGRRNRLLLFAAVLTVVNLVPWVWINHSESLTLERFKTLPLGLGRTEVVVANYYMRKDRSADAEQWFKKAIEVNPRNVNAYYLLGVLYANNGFSEPACRALEVAVSMRGDKVGYRQQYVRALLDAQRCTDAVTHLMWLSRRIPGDFVYWQTIGDRVVDTECESSLPEIYAPVLSEAQRRIHGNPRDEDSRVYAALLLAKTGRLEEAYGLLAGVLEMNPDSAAGNFNGGMVLVQMGRPDEARALLRRFLTLHPNHPMAPTARQYLSPPNQ